MVRLDCIHTSLDLRELVVSLGVRRGALLSVQEDLHLLDANSSRISNSSVNRQFVDLRYRVMDYIELLNDILGLPGYAEVMRQGIDFKVVLLGQLRANAIVKSVPTERDGLEHKFTVSTGGLRANELS